VIGSASADSGYRSLLIAASYPCVKAPLTKVDQEFTEVNGAFLDLLARTERSPGLTQIWLAATPKDDGPAPPPGPVAVNDSATVPDPTAQAELFSAYLQWKGRRDELRLHIDGLSARVREDREGLDKSLVGVWHGVMILVDKTAAAAKDLWSWGQARLG